VTTILTNLVGRSVVSAITQTPASGPDALVTTPPRSSASIGIAVGVAWLALSLASDNASSTATPHPTIPR
jgi:hypothetical protein